MLQRLLQQPRSLYHHAAAARLTQPPFPSHSPSCSFYRRHASRSAHTLSSPPSSSSAAHSSPSSTSAAPASITLLPPNSPRTCLLFPGQGSQRTGSSVRALEENWSHIVKPIFDEMNESVGMNLSRIMKDGSDAELRPTSLAQPAIVGHTYALYSVLAHELGLSSAAQLASVCAGHSVGEYSALAVSGSVSFADVIRLVHARGKVMTPGPGSVKGAGMLALVSGGEPIDEEELRHFLKQVERMTDQRSQVALSIVNSPYQMVLSGANDALEYIRQRVKTQSNGSSSTSTDLPLPRNILRAIPLDVSGPFHMHYMSPARTAFTPFLSKTAFRAPSIPIVFNVTGKSTKDEKQFSKRLAECVDSPIKWHDSISHCLEQLQITRYIEIGPSTPLTGIMRTTVQKMVKNPLWQRVTKDDVQSASNVEELKKLIATIERWQKQRVK